MNDFGGNRRQWVLLGTFVLLAVLLLGLMFVRSTRDESPPDAAPAGEGASEGTAGGGDGPAAGEGTQRSGDLFALLPNTEADLLDAARTAQEFTNAYVRTDEDRMDRLAEFTDAGYLNLLRSTEDRHTDLMGEPLPEGGVDTRSAVTGIRTIAEDTAVYIVGGEITRDGSRSGEYSFAVTVVKQDDRWAVIDVQDAAAGDAGGGA
ncbi:hypothetical protein [Marinitenerispora sediminis]|uniref:Mce-associated membrane protein n=1 Tax=Marinitenerispora sediminis TaxID=1931232 RepID=A0A368T6D4_9ACTN|nr:hypothetical protein [Marinitenerispora sediminis]RCV53236.1 hypothetical protein DEF28_10885 [Marinitenerispora sediminis]RCV54935.1 hypothetical protein DEF23_15030 [Marinitenerispora sediminis]RCV59058.1 hypothetical protein DEF24_11165 [Marinitenerispora sediminis]